MSLYSFPPFTTDFYNPFAQHSLLWNNEDEGQPVVRQSSLNNDHQNHLQCPNYPHHHHHHHHHHPRHRKPLLPRFVRNFAPKFDVRESKDAYHLDGELPGLQHKDLDIEFTDAHTLLIRGQVMREYHSTKTEAAPDPAGALPSVETDKTQNGAGDAEEDKERKGSNGSHHHHQPTVEDADEDGNALPQSKRVATSPSESRSRAECFEVASRKHARDISPEYGGRDKKQKLEHAQGQGQGSALCPCSEMKIWALERTTGNFHRTFNFPSRVNQDGVKASLKDGLLSVFVPKLKELSVTKKIKVN